MLPRIDLGVPDRSVPSCCRGVGRRTTVERGISQPSGRAGHQPAVRSSGASASRPVVQRPQSIVVVDMPDRRDPGELGLSFFVAVLETTLQVTRDDRSAVARVGRRRFAPACLRRPHRDPISGPVTRAHLTLFITGGTRHWILALLGRMASAPVAALRTPWCRFARLRKVLIGWHNCLSQLRHVFRRINTALYFNPMPRYHNNNE